MTTILGLDLGKFKSVSCLYERTTQEARYSTITTDPDSVRKHLVHLRPDLVVFETCTVAGWVADLCAELDLAYQVANPMNEAWPWRQVKRKTDRDDALKLARMAALGELPTVHVPTPEARPYRGLVAYRTRLIGRRTSIQDHIRALCEQQGLLLPAGHRAWTEVGRTYLATLGQPPEDCDATTLWRGELALEFQALEQVIALIRQADAMLDTLAETEPHVRLLQTIPGVGRRTAEVIAAYLDDPGRFHSGREVSAYAGLVPRQFPSGQTDRKGRITKRGPRLLRKVLVEASWLMLRDNAWAARLFARIGRGQKTRRKQALVAVARKFLVRCWAMRRTGEPWRPGPEAA